MSKRHIKAVELGKIWMKNSVNNGHDFEHAQFVENNALEVYKSLKNQKIRLEGTTEEMVRIVAWWHDCYKARLKRPDIFRSLLEGFKAAKITKRELSPFLNERELKAVLKAIKYHHLPLYYFVMRWRHPILSQILIEADGIEDLNLGRKSKQLKEFGNPLSKFLYRLHNRVMIYILKKISISEYTLGILKKI